MSTSNFNARKLPCNDAHSGQTCYAREGRNTPIHFMLQKVETSPDQMCHWAHMQTFPLSWNDFSIGIPYCSSLSSIIHRVLLCILQAWLLDPWENLWHRLKEYILWDFYLVILTFIVELIKLLLGLRIIFFYIKSVSSIFFASRLSL